MYSINVSTRPLAISIRGWRCTVSFPPRSSRSNNSSAPLIRTFPPAIPSPAWATSANLNLAEGNYAVVVKSHGGYGDLGNYTLGIRKPELLVLNPNVTLQQATFSGSGAGSGGQSTAAAAMYAADGGQASTTTKKRNDATADQVFAGW